MITTDNIINYYKQICKLGYEEYPVTHQEGGALRVSKVLGPAQVVGMHKVAIRQRRSNTHQVRCTLGEVRPVSVVLLGEAGLGGREGG